MASRYEPMSPFCAVTVVTVTGPPPPLGAFAVVCPCGCNPTQKPTAKTSRITSDMMTRTAPLRRFGGASVGGGNWCSGPIAGCSFWSAGKVIPHLTLVGTGAESSYLLTNSNPSLDTPGPNIGCGVPVG